MNRRTLIGISKTDEEAPKFDQVPDAKSVYLKLDIAMTSTLHTFIQIASRILNRPESELDPDTPLQDLGFEDEEWRDMLEEACELHGAPLNEIINTLPVYRLKRSDTSLASLSELATFSTRATAMLAVSTTQIHLDTLRSLAASVDKGRYVPSGQMSDDLHQPNTPAWVVGKGIGLVSVAVGLPLLNAFGPCNPICRDCFAPPSERFWEIGVYSFPAMLIITALWFGPGLYEIWCEDRKLKRRGKRRAKDRLGTDLEEHRDGRNALSDAAVIQKE